MLGKIIHVVMFPFWLFAVLFMMFLSITVYTLKSLATGLSFVGDTLGDTLIEIERSIKRL